MRYFSLKHDLAWMICDIFQFNVICRRRSLTALVLSWRLVESDVTVTPSVTCVGWLRWWYNHTADVVLPSTALASVTKMNEKCKSRLHNAVQVKNWWKTVSSEEKLDVINQLEKGDQITDFCHNVRFTHISVCTIHDGAERITETA